MALAGHKQMPYPFTNRKRIRGWKRRVSELNDLTSREMTLDLDRLKTYNSYAFELLVAPFSNLTGRNPPTWYSRLWIEAMATVHRSWHDQLRATGQDFYLRTWIFDPRFFRSLVIVAIGPRIQHYESFFPSIGADAHVTFPSEKYRTPSHNLFSWTAAVDEDTCSKVADDLEPSFISWLLKRGAVAVETEGDTIYHTRKGHVWIGKMAG